MSQPARPFPRPVGITPRPRPVREVFFTVEEAANMMRVSKMTVYRLIHGKELRAIKVIRSFRIPLSALDDYLKKAEQDVELNDDY